VAFAEGTRSATPGCKLTSVRAVDDNCQHRATGPGGRTHEKERGDCGPLGAVVSWMRLRKRKSPSAARASSNEQCKTPWIVRTPSACKPCPVSTGPRFTRASQTCCACSGDTSQVYNPVPVSHSAGKRGLPNLPSPAVPPWGLTDGKRGGAQASVLAPILDSTQVPDGPRHRAASRPSMYGNRVYLEITP
jgi:hypothetical protein